MDEATAAAVNGLNARLLAIEAAMDAVLCVIAEDPKMQAAVASVLEANEAGTRHGLSGASDEQALRTLGEAFERLRQALGLE